MADEHDLEVMLDPQAGYRFLVDFEQACVPPLLMDEPEPLGDGGDRAPAGCSPRPSATASAPARSTACAARASTCTPCAPS
jgi:hypothetical protein